MPSLKCSRALLASRMATSATNPDAALVMRGFTRKMAAGVVCTANKTMWPNLCLQHTEAYTARCMQCLHAEFETDCSRLRCVARCITARTLAIEARALHALMMTCWCESLH